MKWANFDMCRTLVKFKVQVLDMCQVHNESVWHLSFWIWKISPLIGSRWANFDMCRTLVKFKVQVLDMCQVHNESVWHLSFWIWKISPLIGSRWANFPREKNTSEVRIFQEEKFSLPPSSKIRPATAISRAKKLILCLVLVSCWSSPHSDFFNTHIWYRSESTSGCLVCLRSGSVHHDTRLGIVLVIGSEGDRHNRNDGKILNWLNPNFYHCICCLIIARIFVCFFVVIFRPNCLVHSKILKSRHAYCKSILQLVSEP